MTGFGGCGRRQRTGLGGEEGLHVVRRLLQVAGAGIGRCGGRSPPLRGGGRLHLPHHVGAVCLDWLHSDQVGPHWLKRTICTCLKYPCRFGRTGGQGLGQAAAVPGAPGGLVRLASHGRRIDLLKKAPGSLVLRFPSFLLDEGAQVLGPGGAGRTPAAPAAVTGRHAVGPHSVRRWVQGLERGAPASSGACGAEPGARGPGKGPISELIARGGSIQTWGLPRGDLLVLSELQVLCVLAVRAPSVGRPCTRHVAPQVHSSVPRGRLIVLDAHGPREVRLRVSSLLRGLARSSEEGLADAACASVRRRRAQAGAGEDAGPAGPSGRARVFRREGLLVFRLPPLGKTWRACLSWLLAGCGRRRPPGGSAEGFPGCFPEQRGSREQGLPWAPDAPWGRAWPPGQPEGSPLWRAA